jgi:hypothetical protein
MGPARTSRELDLRPGIREQPRWKGDSALRSVSGAANGRYLKTEAELAIGTTHLGQSISARLRLAIAA